MTATRTPATEIRTPPAPGGRRRRALSAAAALSVAALATAGVLAGGASRAEAAVATNCAANPVACGYPGAATTGVPSGTTLKTVPSQVSSGPGWSYNAADGEVIVTGKGATLTGLSI